MDFAGSKHDPGFWGPGQPGTNRAFNSPFANHDKLLNNWKKRLPLYWILTEKHCNLKSKMKRYESLSSGSLRNNATKSN